MFVSTILGSLFHYETNGGLPYFLGHGFYMVGVLAYFYIKLTVGIPFLIETGRTVPLKTLETGRFTKANHLSLPPTRDF